MSKAPPGVGYCRKLQEWVRCTSKACPHFKKHGLRALTENFGEKEQWVKK